MTTNDAPKKRGPGRPPKPRPLNPPPKRPVGRPPKPRPENPEPPRPVGRPALGDAGKIHSLSVRATDEEYRLWSRLAAEQGVTLANFITGPLRRELEKKGYK